MISSDPVGGFERLTEQQRRDVRLLAGVEFTRRGAAQTKASGRLCLWKHRQGQDRRLDDSLYKTFERYRYVCL